MPSKSQRALMRTLVGPGAALCIGWLFASFALGSNSEALAKDQRQTAPAQVTSPILPSMKQIALTEKQVQGVLAASKDIRTITDNTPEDIDKLSPETTAKLDVVAKRNGFASYDEYNNVNENIGLVMGGIDPVSRKYVGKEAWVKAQMARVRADKKMSADAKKEALTDLSDNLQLPLPPIQYKGNIALVSKYLDKLEATMPAGE
jgi:hypothetical protein